MAEKVVLSEMVVRITGDNRDYQQKLSQAETGTKKLGSNVERLGKLSIGKASGALGLGGFGGALAGFGPAGAAIGLATLAAKQFFDELHKGNQIANQAFKQVATGARTIQEAMAGIRVDALTQGLQEVAEHVNPEGFSQRLRGWRDSITGAFTGQSGIEVVVDRARIRVRRGMQGLQEALRLTGGERRALAIDRNVQAGRELTRSLEEQAERSGLATGAAQRLEQVQRLAREGSLGRAEAERLLNRELERQAEAEGASVRNRLQRETVRGLREQAELARLAGGEQAALAEAFRITRERGLGLERLPQVMREYGRELAEVRRLTDEGELNAFVRTLQEQVQTFGLSAERAQIYRLRLRGVNVELAEAALRQRELLELLSRPFQQVTGARLGSAEDIAQSRESERQRRFIGEALRGRLLPQGATAPLGGAQGTRQGSAADAEQRRNNQRMLVLLDRIARNTARAGAPQTTPANLN